MSNLGALISGKDLDEDEKTDAVIFLVTIIVLICCGIVFMIMLTMYVNKNKKVRILLGQLEQRAAARIARQQ